VSDQTPSPETWVCRASHVAYGYCTSPVGVLPGHGAYGPAVPPAPTPEPPLSIADSDDPSPWADHPPTPSPVSPEDGVALIAAERLRQISEEGWTPEHDDHHDDSELVMAAEAYLWASRFPVDADHVPMPTFWPWDVSWWKPSPDPTRNLVRAGALIAAEIDRRRRASGAVS